MIEETQDDNEEIQQFREALLQSKSHFNMCLSTMSNAQDKKK